MPQKRPTARDVQTSPILRRDLLSFGSAFGEPVTAPHVVHTWPLGWTVGSIGGDALRVDRLTECKEEAFPRPRTRSDWRKASSGHTDAV